MKKLISLLLVLGLCAALFAACGGQATPTEAPAAETTAAPTEATTPQASIDALDGKKVLFIGNSYTYWGSVVINVTCTNSSQQDRSHDKGLFYQLCQEKGINADVTNWVFAGHDLTDMTGEECLCADADCCGTNHISYLQDRFFDYVCIQPFFESEYTGDIVSHLTPTMDLFKAANPDVKFLLLVPHATFFRNFKWKGELQAAADAGITVVNWGGMLDDLSNKRVTIPGSNTQCFQSSFVIGKTEKDGHHQNLLAGYLTAMMTYCAITGESAVGQPYAFADDPTIHPNFNMEQFQKDNYIYESFTNFVDIYRSETDMLGLQQLADNYLNKFNGGN